MLPMLRSPAGMSRRAGGWNSETEVSTNRALERTVFALEIRAKRRAFLSRRSSNHLQGSAVVIAARGAILDPGLVLSAVSFNIPP